MLARSALSEILDNEALTRHLGDAEARVLVEWLVDQAESAAERVPAEKVAAEVRQLCRRGRALARFVQLWAVTEDRGAAIQLAGCEQFDWPLPDGPVEPSLLMSRIVRWESRNRGRGG
jgi:hypothetical protein